MCLCAHGDCGIVVSLYGYIMAKSLAIIVAVPYVTVDYRLGCHKISVLKI